MNAVQIRNADPKDREGIASLIVPIQREEFGVAVTYEQQPDLVDISGFYQQGCGGFWVATLDGQIVGSIALKDIGGNMAALRKMFVKMDFRGKTHGVAKHLLDHLLGHAKKAGVKSIYLGTTPMFLAAHRFYEKNGFERVNEADLPPGFPVMAVDKRFYKLDL